RKSFGFAARRSRARALSRSLFFRRHSRFQSLRLLPLLRLRSYSRTRSGLAFRAARLRSALSSSLSAAYLARFFAQIASRFLRYRFRAFLRFFSARSSLLPFIAGLPSRAAASCVSRNGWKRFHAARVESVGR